jgi:hypothetical protein
MKELLCEITIQELLTLSNPFLGKKVEVATSSPIHTKNTYSLFGICQDENSIIIYDKNLKQSQELRISIPTISKILYMEGDNFFETTFSVFLNNDIKIDFCTTEEPIRCCQCGNIINLDPYATIWNVSGYGNYGSHLDGESMNVKLCDDCMFYDVLGYTDEMFNNMEEENYYM